MDFVFDRTAEGRVLKALTIVDDATHEAVANFIRTQTRAQLDALALAQDIPLHTLT